MSTTGAASIDVRIAGSSDRWLVVSRVLGGVLMLAAVLKGIELRAEPSRGLRDWLEFVWMQCEVVIGALLLLDVCRSHAWRIALGCFAAFFVVSASKAFSGAESCGCFGQWHIRPKYTAILDLAAVVAIALCRGGAQRSHAPSRRLSLFSFFGVVTTVVLLAAMVLVRPSLATLGEGGAIDGNGAVVLEPQKWLGQRFPLAKYIDVGPALLRGRWIVLLYRADCERCQRAIPRYERLAEEMPREPGFVSVALIELPSHSSPGPEWVPRKTAVLVGRFTGARQWVVQTPVLLRIADGKVAAIAQGDNAEDPEPW